MVTYLISLISKNMSLHKIVCFWFSLETAFYAFAPGNRDVDAKQK